MAEYRDPKVTTTEGKKKNDMTKWIGIAVAVIVLLLLLGWILGWFNNEAEVETIDPAVVEEPVGDEPVVVE